ncbi:unnamed protein product, partial [Prorocentrum cordatum]
DETKHALHVGVVAGLYGAERIQAIDRRITNRNFLLCGGSGVESFEDAQKFCSQGRPGHSEGVPPHGGAAGSPAPGAEGQRPSGAEKRGSLPGFGGSVRGL